MHVIAHRSKARIDTSLPLFGRVHLSHSLNGMIVLWYGHGHRYMEFFFLIHFPSCCFRCVWKDDLCSLSITHTVVTCVASSSHARSFHYYNATAHWIHRSVPFVGWAMHASNHVECSASFRYDDQLSLCVWCIPALCTAGVILTNIIVDFGWWKLIILRILQTYISYFLRHLSVFQSQLRGYDIDFCQHPLCNNSLNVGCEYGSDMRGPLASPTRSITSLYIMLAFGQSWCIVLALCATVDVEKKNPLGSFILSDLECD